jgi:hypothetical protein
MPSTLGRNDPCHCGSGKKYKACHLGPDEAKAREVRAKVAEDAPAAASAEAPAEPAKSAPATPRHGTRQPWKGGIQNTRGFQKVTASRKVGGGG